MKRVVLAVLLALGVTTVVHAQPNSTELTSISAAPSDAQCKYKLTDAVAGLKELKVIAFEPKAQSPDGNRVSGTLFFHNPKSSKADSVDAMALVLIDKAAGKQLTFLVAYLDGNKAILYKREVSKDGKTVGPCFEKEVKDISKETSK